jgi:hypothetical protein
MVHVFSEKQKSYVDTQSSIVFTMDPALGNF